MKDSESLKNKADKEIATIIKEVNQMFGTLSEKDVVDYIYNIALSSFFRGYQMSLETIKSKLTTDST